MYEECVANHVTGLDLLLKSLGLVQSPWEAIDEEAAAATGQHGLLQKSNGHLQNVCMTSTLVPSLQISWIARHWSESITDQHSQYIFLPI